MTIKEILAVDCDDTLISYSVEYLAFLSERIGRKLDVKNVKTTEWHVHAGLPQDEFWTHVHDFMMTETFANLPDITNARDRIYSLRDRYDIQIVTARPDFASKITRDNLEMRFPGLVSKIHHANISKEGTPIRREKLEICREIGAKILVEDNPNEAQTFVANGYSDHVAILMLGRPWSDEAYRIGLPKRVVPMNNWNETIDYLLTN